VPKYPVSVLPYASLAVTVIERLLREPRRSQARHRQVSACHQGQTVVDPTGDRGDTGEVRRDRGLAVGVVAPGDDRAVGLQSETVDIAAGDGGDAV